MKYLVDGLEIHSDRAAIPSGRKSKRFMQFLSRLKKFKTCVDYGCGKLRHIHELLEVFDTVTVVDSEVQLNKLQVIHGFETTVASFCQKFSGRVMAHRIADVSKIRRRHDWAFLNNVLSAIPNRSARVQALKNIRRLLKPGGRLLVISQYENSKFSTFEAGRKHLDGYIFRSKRGLHFFGRISLQVLRRYLSEANLRTEEIRSVKGYYFIVARR